MYFLVKALTEIKSSIQILSFPFLARPPEVSPNMGVLSHPGFHTTTDINTAALYALGKVATGNTLEQGDGTYGVTDFPVVVGLNMEGYDRELDYDAENFVRDGVETVIKEVITHLPDEYDDIDVLTELEMYHEMYDQTGGEPIFNKQPIDLFSEEQFKYMMNPGQAILRLEDPVTVITEYLRTGEISKEHLMEITDQYRYLNDVPHTQILKVWYVTPVAEDATDAVNDDEGIDEMLAKWPGFMVLDYDDVYSGHLEPEFTEIWARDNLEEIPMEYHGTTYLRLLQAVPEFASQLPEPPSPPYSP